MIMEAICEVELELAAKGQASIPLDLYEKSIAAKFNTNDHFQERTCTTEAQVPK